MRRIVPCVFSTVCRSLFAVLPMAFAVYGCQSSPSIEIPPQFIKSPAQVPSVISFSSGEPQINVETMLILVPTRVLDSTAIIKKLHLQEGAAANAPVAADNNGQLPATDLKAIHLDQQAFNDFLAEIQNNQRTLANPHIDLVSGQPASFSVTQSLSYVKSFQKTEPPAGSKAPPKIQLNPETLTTGIWLELAATIAPDNNSLITQIHPTLITCEGIDTFTTESSPGPVAFVQMPKTTTTSIKTSVSIANGSTLLIVGPKRMEEKEVTTSGFLFTNHYYIKDECTLLVVVRPTIATHAAAAANAVQASPKAAS